MLLLKIKTVSDLYALAYTGPHFCDNFDSPRDWEKVGDL